jgi:hypothetical protein
MSDGIQNMNLPPLIESRLRDVVGADGVAATLRRMRPAEEVMRVDTLTAIIHEAPVLARGAMFEGPLLLDAHR